MKKQLIKEITDIIKLIKNEQKIKSDLDLKIDSLEQEINIIEQKFETLIKDKITSENFPKLTKLNKLYETSLRKNREKTYIQYYLKNFQKENDIKIKALQKKFQELKEKDNKNQNLLERKKDELINEYSKVERYFPEDKKQEKYIIPPETMSIHMISKINSEMDFIQAIKDEKEKIKLHNENIIKQIDNNRNILNLLKSKKERRESSYNELSTTAKISSNKNHMFQQPQLESNNNINTNNNNNENNNNIENNNNNENTNSSIITLDIVTNLNLDNLPSNDESLRFIDIVPDTNSHIKPIKNNFEEKKYYPPSASIPKEQTRKAEPIKVVKPLDYKIRNEKIMKDINDIKKEIENKKINIENFKEKRKKIEEENTKKKQNLKHANMKIKIIKDQIEVLKKQINEFKKKGKYGEGELKNNQDMELCRMYSICNIINNKNYYLSNINEENYSKLNTLRK